MSLTENLASTSAAAPVPGPSTAGRVPPVSYLQDPGRTMHYERMDEQSDDEDWDAAQGESSEPLDLSLRSGLPPAGQLRQESSNHRGETSRSISREDCVKKHSFRMHRKICDKLLEKKAILDGQRKDFHCEEKLIEYLITEETLEAFNMAIEYLNLNKDEYDNLVFPNTEAGRYAATKFKKLSTSEIFYLFQRYFQRVVDLRENGQISESTIAELDQKLELSNYRIAGLNLALQQMRSQNNTHMVMRYPAAPASTALALPEGTDLAANKCIPRIPKQNLQKLQGNPQPPTKVYFTTKKLIIERPPKKKK